MRQYRTYIIILAALAAIAVYFWVSDKSSTMRVSSNYFAITDTSAVSSIRIIKNADTLLLEKLNNNWVVNSKYNARTKLINQLLGMVSLIEINTPAPKQMRNDLIRDYLGQPLQVVFYNEKQAIKTFKIVESDSILRATVMFTEADNEPYIVKIPGFDGRISMLFPTNPLLYRDKTVFRYQPFEILYIKVEYPQNPEKSFMFNMSNPSDMFVQSLTNDSRKQMLKEKAIQYAMNFSNVHFEFVQSMNLSHVADSLKNIQPSCIIQVKNIANQINQVNTYTIAVQGKKQQFDLFKMYAVIQNDSLPVVIKYTDFDPIMKEFDGFSNK